jgi:hypothetical protein
LTRFLQGNLHGDDGIGGTLDIPCTAAGSTDQKLYDLYQAQAAFLEESNDPTHIYTWTQEFPNPIATVYWQFDATNVAIFSNYFADLFYLIAVILGNIPQCGIMKAKLGTDYSPRRGWTDDLGKKRKPPPSDKGLTLKTADFSGVPGLLQALASLPDLAAQLTKQGKLREANIVLYAYNQVVNQNWTITEAFDYLDKNGIL